MVGSPGIKKRFPFEPCQGPNVSWSPRYEMEEVKEEWEVHHSNVLLRSGGIAQLHGEFTESQSSKYPTLLALLELEVPKGTWKKFPSQTVILEELLIRYMKVSRWRAQRSLALISTPKMIDGKRGSWTEFRCIYFPLLVPGRIQGPPIPFVRMCGEKNCFGSSENYSEGPFTMNTRPKSVPKLRSIILYKDDDKNSSLIADTD